MFPYKGKSVAKPCHFLTLLTITCTTPSNLVYISIPRKTYIMTLTNSPAVLTYDGKTAVTRTAARRVEQLGWPASEVSVQYMRFKDLPVGKQNHI